MPITTPATPFRRRSLSRHAALTAAGLAAVTALASLTACGGSHSSEGARGSGVASLAATSPPAPGSGPSSGSSTSAAGENPAAPAPDPSNTASGRPQIRLDDSPATQMRLTNAYASCLIQHGATRETGGAGKEQGGIQAIGVKDGAPRAAIIACESKEPLMPTSEDPDNPHARDYVRDEVNCINRKGYETVRAYEGGLSWTYVRAPRTQEQGEKAMAAERACHIQVYSHVYP
ncbi:hypothetical protein ACFZAM_15535 [Streptomyces sp. NPDC008079]|uniref:hypothetical protein n=1 Tax=Streptomyces sp. NPDC008079 TaxID=3364806 RepID=UPI0036E0A760